LPKTDSVKLGSVKTEILVGWIFALLVLIAWIWGFLWYTIVLGILSSVLGIISLVMLVPSIFVFHRTNQMRRAAKAGNLSRLRQLNSVSWGIVALTFTGVIPGIMLLMAHGPIDKLRPASTGGGMAGGR